MRIALGSDERTHLTDLLAEELAARGHTIELFGPLAGDPASWPELAEAVARRVASAACDQGILCCWTGTGVSIAANKVPGIRAALCGDSETAHGARRWNDANVLCLSLRATSEPVAREILEAWFSTTPDPSESDNIAKVKRLDHLRSRA